MNKVAAIEKEIKKLDDLIRRSLEQVDKEKNILVGSSYRFVLRMQKESYQRILKDLTDGQ